MAHHATSIATAQRVHEAAEAMLAEGYPVERISQNAIRARLGGGSMATIHRHLKPFLDEKRAQAAAQRPVVVEKPEHDPAHVPEAARQLLDGLKTSADELGKVVVQLIDAAVAGERHRQELARDREQAEHRRIAEHLQSVLDEVRHDLEQTVAESTEYQEQLDTAHGRLEVVNSEATELRARTTDLEQQLQDATARAEAAERDAAQKDARITDLEQEICRGREAFSLAEDRVDRAEQRADDAEKARAAAERRAHAAVRAKPVRVTRARRAGPGSLETLGVDPARGRRLRKPRAVTRASRGG